MEFIVSRNTLLKALNHARCFITKGAIQVFQNFVFTLQDDGISQVIKIHASNGELWFTEEVLLDSLSTDTPSELRSFSVYFNDLLLPIKALEEQPLLFKVGEYQLSVHHSIGSFRIPLGNNAEEFLSIPQPHPDIAADDGHVVPYEAPGLRSILERCRFAMAKDELRPVMNGVYINLTEDYSDYVSSDGHKLVRVRKNSVRCKSVPTIFSCIIPSRVVTTLLRILPSTGDVDFEYQEQLTEEHTRESISFDAPKKETYTVIVRKAQARFVIDGVITLSFTPIDGRYPQYWTVIPDKFNYKMDIDRRQLIKSVDRLSIFADTSQVVMMNIAADSLELRTRDTDFDIDGEETLPCRFSVLESHNNQGSLRVGLKAPSLSSMLKALSTEKVLFRFIDETRAIIIQPQPQPDVEDITMLLMPMLLTDKD